MARPKDPILVTGVPRSGTTWLARWLADGGGMALPGREPMNPRSGSYALGGTVSGWARLTDLTPGQRRRLRLAYRGLNPFVYSRYGHRQSLAPLPSRRVVIKDPFALLSVPAIAAATGARPVLVYRHPGAVLASYRRMGWTPDQDELKAVVLQAAKDGVDVPVPPRLTPESPEAMGHFWATLHELALADAERAGLRLTVVSHPELAATGHEGGRRLAHELQVPWTPAMARELDREDAGTAVASGSTLHQLDRPPGAVAHAWRGQLTDAETAAVEAVTTATRERLSAARLPLGD